MILAHIKRLEVASGSLKITLTVCPKHPDPKDDAEPDLLVIPWTKPPSRRPRDILPPAGARPDRDRRPVRAETRTRLITAIATGRRWLGELVAGTVTSVDQIAARERCSIRQVHMTISLAFLAPTLVSAAIEGRLPRGIGVANLRDAPLDWSRQLAMLGLST